MKKNKTMRAATAFLILTLLTTCVISGTFAKYVTEANGKETARVAKWGVTVTASGSAFAKEYDTDDQTVTAITKSVVAINEDKLVAPGTDGTLASAAISGKPEVAVRVSYTAALTISDTWKVDNKEYFPIIFTVGTKDYKMGATASTSDDASVANVYTSIATLKAAVEEAIAAASNDYAANTDLSKIADADKLAVSWRWEFEGGKEGAALAGYQTDAKDTALGNLVTITEANGTTVETTTVTGAPTIELSVTTTVTQID